MAEKPFSKQVFGLNLGVFETEIMGAEMKYTKCELLKLQPKTADKLELHKIRPRRNSEDFSGKNCE